ncbi:hypothetical protein FKP32DRAFT_1177561 [Trametes sanguinea]|nr:hypothetical protein FKP32DRAFT_1177561 [Trametes sanguinea]
MKTATSPILVVLSCLSSFGHIPSSTARCIWRRWKFRAEAARTKLRWTKRKRSCPGMPRFVGRVERMTASTSAAASSCRCLSLISWWSVAGASAAATSSHLLKQSTRRQGEQPASEQGRKRRA